MSVQSKGALWGWKGKGYSHSHPVDRRIFWRSARSEASLRRGDDEGQLLTCICGGIHPGWFEPTLLIGRTISIDEYSWVVSTSRSPVPVSLHLLALQLEPKRPLFTPLPRFGFNSGDATGVQGVEVWSIELCWLHHHFLDHYVGRRVLNLMPSPGIPNHLH